VRKAVTGDVASYEWWLRLFRQIPREAKKEWHAGESKPTGRDEALAENLGEVIETGTSMMTVCDAPAAAAAAAAATGVLPLPLLLPPLLLLLLLRHAAAAAAVTVYLLRPAAYYYSLTNPLPSARPTARALRTW